MPVNPNQQKSSSKIVTISDMSSRSANETSQTPKIVSIESTFSENHSVHHSMRTAEVAESQSSAHLAQAYHLVPTQEPPPLIPSIGLGTRLWLHVSMLPSLLSKYFFAFGAAGVFFVLGSISNLNQNPKQNSSERSNSRNKGKRVSNPGSLSHSRSLSPPYSGSVRARLILDEALFHQVPLLMVKLFYINTVGQVFQEKKVQKKALQRL